jgi:hypothetical protein
MLSNGSMFNVDESVDKRKSLGEDPMMSDEFDDDEVEHDPFEFLNDDDTLFSRLLSNSLVWQVQGSNNGNANMNMPIFDYFVQVSNALA